MGRIRPKWYVGWRDVGAFRHGLGRPEAARAMDRRALVTAEGLISRSADSGGYWRQAAIHVDKQHPARR